MWGVVHREAGACRGLKSQSGGVENGFQANYPVGRASGNHWGEAAALLVTPVRSPFYFSLHASDPHSTDGGTRRDIGHTLILGPTGSGKTVWIGFLLAMRLIRETVSRLERIGDTFGKSPA